MARSLICSRLFVCLVAIVYTRQADAICTDPVCYFELNVSRGSAMTYTTPNAIYNVEMVNGQLTIVGNSYRYATEDPLIGTTVDASQVVTADGYPRNLFFVNGKFPGDPIEVIYGAQVVVKVHNLLLTDSITIHWHGLTMDKTPWMDGVGAHGQCPIEPLTTFTYRFKATPVGTHLYHDHYENQRRDGLYGMIVVHPPPPAVPNPAFEHQVFVADWYHQESEDTNMRSPSRIGIPGTGEYSTHNSQRDYAIDGSEITAVAYESSLINGRGRASGQNTPLEVFQVQPDSKYRFRVVNAASERAYTISIDEHQMKIVALDGSEVVKTAADFIIIQPGERVDMEVATKSTDNGMYWFRSRTLRAGMGPTVIDDGVVQEVKAIVRYPNAAAGEPTSVSKSCTASSRCSVFNCPFAGYPANQYRDCISVDEMQSQYSQSYMSEHWGLNDVAADIDESFYNWANVGPGTSVNGRKTIGAQGVPLYQPGMANYITPCNATECDQQGCICTYYVAKDYDKTIQMVFTNYNPHAGELEHHPIHSHGIHYAVLKIGYPTYDPITGRYVSANPDVQCNNDICSAPSWSGAPPALNLHKPPIKDTVNVPAGGYVVVRFRTMNPGLWFIHCHLASHAIEGMGFYFFEAADKIPPVPPNFPTCGHYEFTEAQYNYYQNLPVP